MDPMENKWASVSLCLLWLGLCYWIKRFVCLLQLCSVVSSLPAAPVCVEWVCRMGRRFGSEYCQSGRHRAARYDSIGTHLVSLLTWSPVFMILTLVSLCVLQVWAGGLSSQLSQLYTSEFLYIYIHLTLSLEVSELVLVIDLMKSKK